MPEKQKCQNEICKQTALLKIGNVFCCGNHTSWAARKGLENSNGKEVTVEWANRNTEAA